jgi:hypothetical protein
MPISNTHRLKAVEDKLNQAKELITQAFSIIQYMDVQHHATTYTADSSRATDMNPSTGLYPGQYKSMEQKESEEQNQSSSCFT